MSYLFTFAKLPVEYAELQNDLEFHTQLPGKPAVARDWSFILRSYNYFVSYVLKKNHTSTVRCMFVETDIFVPYKCLSFLVYKMDA